MSWLDGLLNTAVQILNGITPVPERQKVSFGSGLAATDNPVTGATDITVDGTLPAAPGANALVLQSTGAASTAWRPVAPTLVPSGGSDVSQINAALTAAGHAALSVGSFQVNSNTTIGSLGKTIHFYPGGMLKPASGVTLDMSNVDIDCADDQQIFDLSAGGTVVGLKRRCTPHYFGAKGDGSTDDHAAVVAAIGALPTTGGELSLLASANYACSGQIDLTGRRGIAIRGAGAPTSGALMPSVLTHTGTETSFIKAPSLSGLTIENVQVLYSNPSYSGVLVDYDSTVPSPGANLTLRNCFLGGLDGVNGAAALLSIANTLQTRLEGVQFGTGQIGLRGQPDSSTFANTFVMIGGGFQDGGSVVAHVQNPGQTWGFYGVSFGGLADGSANSIDPTVAAAVAGVTVMGCWFGDITNGGKHIKVVGAGWNIVGNNFSGDASTKALDIRTVDSIHVTANFFTGLDSAVHFADNGTSAAYADVHSNFYDIGSIATPISGYPSAGVIEDPVGNRTYYTGGNHSFTQGGGARLAIDNLLRPYVDLMWGPAVSSVTVGQDQSTTGAGGSWTFRGQQGKAGYQGSNFAIGPGYGGTPGTDAAGAFTIDMGALVSNVSSPTYWKAGDSIGDGSGNFLKLYRNGPGGGVTLEALGTEILNLAAGGDAYLQGAGDLHIRTLASSKKINLGTTGNQAQVQIGATGDNSNVNLAITGSAPTTVGSAGGASALPATPAGYLVVNINGADQKIPFYPT